MTASKALQDYTILNRLNDKSQPNNIQTLKDKVVIYNRKNINKIPLSVRNQKQTSELVSRIPLVHVHTVFISISLKISGRIPTNMLSGHSLIKELGKNEDFFLHCIFYTKHNQIKYLKKNKWH